MATISRNISEAVERLKNGEIIGLPTETVYGLGGNAYTPGVVLNIFKVKKRPSFDPLIVHTNSIDKVKEFVKAFPDPAMQFAAQNWPGPVTLILPKKDIIPHLATSGLNTVAVRIPNHEMTLEVLEGLDFPVAAPSANPFGYVSPTTAQHVNDQLGESIDFILDGGQTSIGIESTIIDFSSKNPTVLRLGGMTLEAIQDHIGHVDMKLSQHSNPEAPGMLDSHYAPSTPLVIGEVAELLPKYQNKKVGIISWSQEFSEVKPAYQYILSPNRDLEEASRNLFSALRRLDTSDVEIILAEIMPDEYLGRAINDRLRRASHK